MSEKEPVSLEALNGLLKERQRYEEWLAALEAKRANTSESVYQRVQGDYQARLRDVSSKLAERAGELKSSIDGLRAKLDEISRQETQQRDARQEAELRAAVGEYTQKQWKEIGGAWDNELSRLTKDKGALDAQLKELTRVYTLTIKENTVEPGAVIQAQDREPPPEAARTPISPVAPRAAVPEPPTLNPPGRVEHPVTSTAPGSAPASANRPRSPFDQFPVLRPQGGSGSSGSPSPGPSAAIATPPSVPQAGRPNDPRSEQHKTLKCPECGAANYPTEWYCERCGGELATM
jgi:TolA-binding protein